jgi:hypothetical protein
MMKKKTLVIDSSYMAKGIITTERAFVISYKGNADIVAEYDESFGLVNPLLEIKKPSIIKVRSYINTPFNKVAMTRENVFRRDDYECVYCGNSERSKLTIDHVIPQSKGGKNVWDNVVTACRSCNLQKADLSLKDFGKEIDKPTRPHYLMLMQQVREMPKEWKPYLFL